MNNPELFCSVARQLLLEKGKVRGWVLEFLKEQENVVNNSETSNLHIYIDYALKNGVEKLTIPALLDIYSNPAFFDRLGLALEANRSRNKVDDNDPVVKDHGSRQVILVERFGWLKKQSNDSGD